MYDTRCQEDFNKTNVMFLSFVQLSLTRRDVKRLNQYKIMYVFHQPIDNKRFSWNSFRPSTFVNISACCCEVSMGKI